MRTLLLRALAMRLYRPKRRRIRSNVGCEVLEFRQMLSAAPIDGGFEQHFDFGTSFSPIATGYTRVAPNTNYSATSGYGWSTGSISSRDRGSSHGDERVRDFNFTQLGTFAVDVPAGTYEVTLTMGDGLALRDEMGVFLEGSQVDSVTSLKGEYETRTYTVTILDGQLTLMLDDLGGANNVVMINSLDVVQVGEPPSGPHIMSTTPVDETRDSIDHITLTFSGAIDPATFTTADVSLIGPAGAVTPTAILAVTAETFEVQFEAQTALGIYTLSVGPDIADSDGQLMNQDGDDLNGEAGEDSFAMTINLIETPEFEKSFDFGTNSSPVADGAIGVTQYSTYSSTDGYGWMMGNIDSRDRGAASGDDQSRDFNFTASGTFVADVLAEAAVYDVTVILGDALADRDEMGVFLEGEEAGRVTTARGTYETRTYRVTVTDGQLTLLLQDLGGADGVAVINSLSIRHVETLSVPDDGDGDDGDDAGGGDDKEDHDPPTKDDFVDANRKNKDHQLPPTAAPTALNPPGHSDEPAEEKSKSKKRSKRFGKWKWGR